MTYNINSALIDSSFLTFLRGLSALERDLNKDVHDFTGFSILMASFSGLSLMESDFKGGRQYYGSLPKIQRMIDWKIK